MATSTPAPRTRRAADRRREILDAAREVFAAKGYESASMAEIAARVGIVEGALYKHFASKRELLFEATRHFYEPLLERTRQQLSGVRGTRNRLRFVIGRQLESFVEHPDVCRLIIHEIRPHGDYARSVVRDLNREAASLLLQILEEGRQEGLLREDVSPALVRDVVFGGVEHLAWKVLCGQGVLDVDRLADEFTDLVLIGIERVARSEAAASDEVGRLRAQVDRLENLIARLASASPAGV